LHFNEFVKSEGLGILRQVHEHCLGQALQVVLDSVLHDVVDVDDQLLELGQALVDMMEIAIDVHGSPCKGNHTWSQLVFQVLEMWHEQTLGVWSNLVDNSVVFFKYKLKLVVVHLEFIFLKKDDFGTLRNINSDSGEALGLSDEGKDL
jgi:hypothetical protein